MPVRYGARPGEWSREASGVFFPEALETRRDKTPGIFESSARAGTGPPPEISRDKAFQSKVTLGEVSREPFQISGEPIVSFCNVSQTSGEPTEGFCQMSPRYHETLEQVRVGLNVSRYVYLLEMSRQCQANSLGPLENSGRASGVSGSVQNGSARVRRQKGKHFIPTGG